MTNNRNGSTIQQKGHHRILSLSHIRHVHTNKPVCNYADVPGAPVYALDKVIAGTIGRCSVFFPQPG